MFKFFTERRKRPSLRLQLIARGFLATVAYPLIQGISLFIIGRALQRRQRWGAYLAALTIGGPFVRQILSPYAPILSITDSFGDSRVPFRATRNV